MLPEESGASGPPRGDLAMQSAAIRRARTDTLEIGYEEHGSPDAPVVMLLHGFPDDARAWDDVVPRLVGAGYRVIVPYLRGFGPTRFLDPARSRTAQQAALGRGSGRPDRRPRSRPRGARRPGLGRPGRLHRRGAPPGARGRPGERRRLRHPGHREGGTSRGPGARGTTLVPVVLQHRARTARPGAEPA